MTGFAKYAGSRILWPPRRASVPPMNTTSARSNSAASSPIESSSSTPGSDQRRWDSELRRQRKGQIPARFSFSATTSNRSGRRGARISSRPGRDFAANALKAAITARLRPHRRVAAGHGAGGDPDFGLRLHPVQKLGDAPARFRRREA